MNFSHKGCILFNPVILYSYQSTLRNSWYNIFPIQSFVLKVTTFAQSVQPVIIVSVSLIDEYVL